MALDPKPKGSPRRPLPSAVGPLLVAGWLLGSLEAVANLRGAGPPGGGPLGRLGTLAVVLLAGSLAAVPAVLLGLLLGLLGWLRRTVGWLGRALERARSLLHVEPARERTQRAQRLGLLVGVVTASGLYVLTVGLLLRRLWLLQAAQLAQWLVLLGAALAALGSAAVAWVIGRLLAAPIGRLDARWPLPWLPAPWARYLVFAFAPTAAVVMPLLRRFGPLLGPLAPALAFVLLGVTAGLLALLWQRFVPAPARSSLGWRLGMLAAVVAWLGLAVGIGTVRPEWTRRAEQGLGGALGAALVRSVSDVDRDGASSLLGGGDCAAWDRSRGPWQSELPGDGVDQNCDGLDRSSSVVPAAQFSDALRPDQVRRYHVVWIMIDGLRADHVGAFGGKHEVTPALDALAADSLVFRHTYSQSSATVFSYASMLTGLNPEGIEWYRYAEWPQPVAEHRTIAEKLRALGYRTALLLNDWTERVYPALRAGYDQVLTPPVLDNWKYWAQQSSPMTIAQAIEFIEQADPDAGPLLLTIHLNDTHYPYVSHPGIPTFGSQPEDRYDGEIAFVDRHVGSLLSHLRFRQPLWSDTVVIVSSDHGEAFGEHGRRFHAADCHGESTHVPLILRVPGLEPGVIDAPTALIDIVPTLLELLGAPRDEGPLHGQSLLVPALTPERSSAERPIFCAIASQFRPHERFFRRAVRAGRHLLTQDVLGSDVSLYDTLEDPRELRDRSTDATKAQVRASLEQLLAEGRTGNLGAELP